MGIFVKKNLETIFLIIFILLAFTLRFYHINRLEFFTYDQARDALYVKRMIVDHEFRLLGTQTSLPGMYLPPFYYYTIAVVLWIFRLNPVGIDIYSALIGVLTVPLAFFVANRVFGRPAGVFSAGLFAVSPLIVELTRRAWNPNTLPFFILLAFYFFFKYFKERKTKDFLLAFTVYGYSLSLHFGAWTLLPLVIFTWFYFLFKNKDLRVSFFAFLIILFFVSPLILFEIRHNFFLVSQAKVFFFDGGHIGAKAGNFLGSFVSSLVAIFTILISGKIMVGYGAPFEFSGKLKDLFSLSQPISVIAQKPFSISFYWWGLLIFVLILIFISRQIYYSIKQKSYKGDFLGLVLICIWILWGIFASRIYSGFFAFFYYLYLFPAPILLFGYLFKKCFEKKNLRFLVVVSFFMIIFFHLRYTTVFQQNWRDINYLRQVAEVVSQNVDNGKPFNIVTIQRDLDRWDRNAVDYRYFVETLGKKRALEWSPQDYQNSQTLFVVDETGGSDPFNSPIMEIQEFGPENVINQWEVEKGIIIYKLTR